MNKVSKHKEDVGKFLRDRVPVHEAIRSVKDEENPNISIQTFADLIHRCTAQRDMEAGKLLHILMIKHGVGSDSYLCDHLIRLFSACDNFEEATHVFDGVKKPSVYTWNAIISAYTKLGRYGKVFALYKKMQEREEGNEGVNPSKVTFLYLLKACGSTSKLGFGRLLHHQIVVESWLDLDVAIGTSLVNMYCKCEDLEDAHKIFSSMPTRNVVTFGAMISGYVRIGYVFLAFELFERYRIEGSEPDKHTFSCILNGCATVSAAEEGKMVHNKVTLEGLDSDVVIGNTLVDMYAKCGELYEARKVFDRLEKKSLVPWGAMISGYVQHGEGLLALKLFQNLRDKTGGYCEQLNPPLFSCILKACGIVDDVDQGKLLHENIIEAGLECDLVVGNALIDMYSKCRNLKEAHKVFDLLPLKNIISWGTLMSGYVQHGHDASAIMLFEEMQERGVVIPDEVVYSCVLRACAGLRSIDLGFIVHDQIIRKQEDINDSLKKALVDVYAKCSMLEEAQNVFNCVSAKDIMLWSVLIGGYVHNGGGLGALKLFMDMQDIGMRPDEIVLSCILKACGHVGAIGHGRWIHDQVIRDGLETNVVVGTSLVEMYTYCGSLQEASSVFQRFSNRNEVSWGALISGYAQTGNCEEVGGFLESMQAQGIKPNDVIMTSALAAYSHAGLLEEGFSYIDTRLKSSDGFVASIEDYCCMVDLLGRAGDYMNAEYLVETMPVQPDCFAWTSLLTSGKTYGNFELAGKCFNGLIKQDPCEASTYVTISNTFAPDRRNIISFEKDKLPKKTFELQKR